MVSGQWKPLRRRIIRNGFLQVKTPVSRREVAWGDKPSCDDRRSAGGVRQPEVLPDSRGGDGEAECGKCGQNEADRVIGAVTVGEKEERDRHDPEEQFQAQFPVMHQQEREECETPERAVGADVEDAGQLDENSGEIGVRAFRVIGIGETQRIAEPM